MRILKANGQTLDIDDNTAIGIDYQAYDFKKPGDIKVNVSNTFTIPATAKNLKIFGFAGRAYSQSNATFTRITVDYYIRNEQYITKGVARIEKIQKGRIHLFVAERPEFIDEMKSTPLNVFLKDWFDNEFVNDQLTSYQIFIDNYRTGHNGIWMPLISGNLALFEDDEGRTPEKIGFIDENDNYANVIGLEMVDLVEGKIQLGGHFFVELDKIFNYIELFFNVNIGSTIEPDYSIFNDSILSELLIPLRQLFMGNANDVYDLRWADDIGDTQRFEPHNDITPFDSLSVYDFFMSTLKIMGYAIEPMPDGSWEIVRLDLIDLVNSRAGDFLPGYMAEGFTEEPFIPNIEGYGVNNFIKMKPYSDGGEYLGSKKGVSANKNLEENKDLFKVDAFVPPFLNYQNVFVPDMSATDSFSTLTFLKKTNNYVSCRVVGIYLSTTPSFSGFPPKMSWPKKITASVEDLTATLMIPEVYTVASEYKFLDDILNTPETRIVKRWVNSSMMRGFRKLAPYYVREFGGWYFVNKISNFNPEKSKEPVKFELIKLPWVRMPGLPEKEIEATDEWILATGKWDDAGIWIDSETWKDN